MEEATNEIKAGFDRPINQEATCFLHFCPNRCPRLNTKEIPLCVFFHSLIVSRIKATTTTATTTATATTTTDPSLSQRSLLFCFLKKGKTYFCRLDLTRDQGVIFLRFRDEKHIFTFILNLEGGSLFASVKTLPFWGQTVSNKTFFRQPRFFMESNSCHRILEDSSLLNRDNGLCSTLSIIRFDSSYC